MLEIGQNLGPPVSQGGGQGGEGLGLAAVAVELDRSAGRAMVWPRLGLGQEMHLTWLIVTREKAERGEVQGVQLHAEKLHEPREEASQIKKHIHRDGGPRSSPVAKSGRLYGCR